MKLKDIKDILPEAIWIVVLAGMFGLINNIFAVKPLSIIPEPKKPNTVSDSLLFSQTNKNPEMVFEVSFSQVLKFIDSTSTVQFIDARSPEMYAEGHIGNAINIFPYMDDQGRYLSIINELPRNKILIVYCDGGNCDLSHELSKTMKEFDYNQVYIYNGGWEEWESKHLNKN